jgi:uncharacterized repeat protein (TIGR03803 family)
MKGMLLLLPALAVVLTTAVGAQTLSIAELFGFPCPNGVCPDGLQPSVLIEASDANFYGVTGGAGGIYKITASGQVTVLYAFQQDAKTGLYDQGKNPVALVEGSDGFLYGLNNQGGPNPSSAGTLFKISKAGTGFQVLQIFCTTCTNGSFPNNLTAASDGNLYGTTEAGGFISTTGVCQNLGCGVVFRVTPPGTFAVLHALDGTNEANYPLGVILASDGNLYGTTGNLNPGTVFRANPLDGQFKTLHSFPSGVFPMDRLTQASNGTLYGISQSTSARTFNLFSSTLMGSVKTVSTVPVPYARGQGVGPLTQATDGNLWSTAIYNTTGYLNNNGEVFAVSTSGTTEHQLVLSGTDGAAPVAGVIQATSGTLYGTATMKGTDANGNTAYGTVFTITGLPAK